VKARLALYALSFGCAVSVSAQLHAIDTAKSKLTVHVYKAGLLSRLGHDHEIAAPIAHGTVDVTGRRVELELKTAAMRVLDPGISAKERAQIQSTMLGPAVLNSSKYPEIMFRSTQVQSSDPGTWSIQGELTMHGETHIVPVQVREMGGHYVGSSQFKQTEFGIQPVKVAGGMVRVKDEVRINFDIYLMQ